MIKVMVVDDQAILRESFKLLIEQDKDIKVVACAGDGQEAFNLCGSLLPDVILMDIVMPKCDGIKGTELIKTKYNSVKVLILSTFGNEENVAMALANGADGYILKEIKSEELILSIKGIAKGLRVIHQDAFNNISNKFNLKSKQDSKGTLDLCVDLTERELNVIRLIVDGKSNKEIASEIHIKQGSVKNIVTSILSKLNLKDRTQVAVFAVKNNLI